MLNYLNPWLPPSVIPSLHSAAAMATRAAVFTLQNTSATASTAVSVNIAQLIIAARAAINRIDRIAGYVAPHAAKFTVLDGSVGQRQCEEHDQRE
ncbi:Hypothetical protein CINCED_3A006572 [Cinara cedri]|uniref:Uncharacterized protein n=1 Tax=Cinara cedri TaxID=506608 RepID=A0A5E4MVS2_9HEMI|nr:Hypothetical protein CINCED_3A006572 [Cinara cedri]